jgi:hypothetical protein
MNKAQQGVSISDVLADIASGSVGNFTLYFARLRKMYPDEVAEACLWFIALRELNFAGRSMAFWLSSQGRYVNILFESDALPSDVGCKALTVLKTVDPSFIINFLKASDRISSSKAILRALNLVPSLGDYSILVPWLRKLCLHADERVKSRGVKLFCELRPNKSLVERQMLSDDPRVRANAIEALWRSGTPDATALFKSAVSDLNHRVVGNALIGLHLQDDPSAIAIMLELSQHRDSMFRATMAWCFGFIHDERAIPVLDSLSRDASAIVRKRALPSLLALQREQALAGENRVLRAPCPDECESDDLQTISLDTNPAEPHPEVMNQSQTSPWNRTYFSPS